MFTLPLQYNYSTFTLHYIKIAFALQYIHLNSYTIYKHWITLDCITLLYKITPITHITQYINIIQYPQYVYIYIHTIQIDTDSHMFFDLSLCFLGPEKMWKTLTSPVAVLEDLIVDL